MVYRSSSTWPGIKHLVTLFLNILFGLLVHVLLLISRVINDVLLLLYQILQGYLMVLAFQIHSLSFELVVIGIFPYFTTDASFF